MTIEEKARAYDEALERVRFYHGNCPSESERKKLERMFPVLRKSEDESIRKELIEFLREAYSRGNAPEECAKWLVWLDRPKEQKEQEPVPFSCGHENGKSAEWAELQSEFKSINEAFEDGKKEVIDHPDKYGLTKQKPVESIEGGVLTHLGNED